ncbi:MAG: LL-diaminopimelate aminotransferase [Candidatus Omnitrophota bacterium]|nr:MAG: LL-diaminopimelate aminotransferase [Candidatus Omnitrophota bacterium]
MQEANRLKRLPLYLFTIIDELKDAAQKKGVDIIDLGMGNPDQPTAKHIVDELCRKAAIKENHRYSRSIDESEKKLREAIAKWYHTKFGVTLDPRSEILPLIGSKEGIAHLSLAFLNNEDIALVPNPAYPVHFNGVLIAGGILHNIPIYEKDGYLPNLKSVPKRITDKAKLLFLSYPHNPTTAVANTKFFEDVVDWARGKNIIIGHDLAYSDIVFDNYKAPSIFQIKGAKETCIEFHTCSKSYNMAGWRMGFAVGNRDILKVLMKTKSYIDFGIFKPIQYAAIKALLGPQGCVKKTVAIYKKRRDTLVKGLREIGWNVPMPKATFYLWARIPDKYSALTSMEFVSLLIRETGVVIAPGTGFGEYGEGYVRFALVEDTARIKEAVKRIKRILEMET